MPRRKSDNPERANGAGLKSGQRHSGSFKPGYDPRRRGDSQQLALKKEISALCQTHSAEAVDRLVEIMRDREEETSRVLQAIDMLLSYGHGRPVSREQHLSIIHASGGGADGGVAPKDMTDSQLLRLISSVEAATVPPPGAEPEILDAEYTEASDVEPDPS